MARIARSCLGSGVMLALIFLVGCSDPYGDRFEVSGTVKLKGKPIPDGAIVIFDPMEGQKTTGSPSTTGGEFKMPKEGGLAPGKYLVRITLPDMKAPTNVMNPNEPPGPTGGTNFMAKDLVPEEWNVKSTQKVDVKNGPGNTFNFDIP